ncbi:MAG: radical SAM family heme chaperone HemW [Treponema sp.]|nr:radical SAM family heme chaperone HemW [Treponema sp.]
MKNNTGLYIHIPFCTRKCDYCDFFSLPVGAGGVSDDYIDAVINESHFYSKKLNIQMWSTIYVGGGTPSLLTPKQLSRLISGVKAGMDESLSPAETTVEMNPQSLSLEMLDSARASGVDRISLGIQSLNDSALGSVHRSCSSATALKALDTVKKHWSGRLNLDCMAGLPSQTTDEFASSLKAMLSYGPDHVSMYTLTIEPGTPLASRVETGMDFDFDAADSQWITGRKILRENGFHQYEVSNFSKDGCESVHNMSYWRQKDYVGVGAGATGSVYGFYGKDGLRWTNARDIRLYCDFWNGFPVDEEKIPRETERLDEATKEFEYLMMGLRTLEGLAPEDYRNRFSALEWNGSLSDRLGIDSGPWKRFSDRNLCADHSKTGRYALNEDGILFLNALLREYVR